jgi:hypothetical protein
MKEIIVLKKIKKSKLEENINLGYICKSCHEVIRDKSKWGKPVLCDGCEDAIKYGISWH